MCFTIAGFANEHVAHLWQLIECNGGKPVARGQTADYLILPMNTVPDEELRAKQLVSNLQFLKKITCMSPSEQEISSIAVIVG